jgi:hypothetical protein
MLIFKSNLASAAELIQGRLQEDIDGRGNRSDQFSYLIDFALYYAGKMAILEVRQNFFVPSCT